MINGNTLRDAIVSAAHVIASQKQKVDELNVFPVPDGDTGTNMSMTIGASVRELSRLRDPSVEETAKVAASALLRGARGNSGVILSLLFRGFSKGLSGKVEADGADLADALSIGVEAAYKAVMKPTEGTILTVAREAAETGTKTALLTNDPVEVFTAIVNQAEETLKKTPEMLPVLKKAGVVDAGGKGLCVIFGAMLDIFKGGKVAESADSPVDKPAPKRSAVASADGDITFTYCTEFIAARKDKARNVGRLRAILSEIGDSLVVVDDDDIVKVHVHTDQPNKALEEGLKFGPLLTVKIENMREQHTAKVIEGTADEPRERVVVPPEKPFGYVAVAAGDGLKALFADLGVDEVVQGGQTMNPSTDDIVRAVDAVPAETVFVLPNNKNIIMAAEQAVHLAEGKKIVVVPTRTIPQGISAMLAADPDCGDEAALTEAMRDAAHHVRSGQVTYAARDSEYDGKKIKQGEYLSLLEGRLCASGRESAVLKKLVREMVTDESAFATVIYGEGVTEQQAAEVEALLHKENKEMEISVVDGGQPVYYYILSVE